jgi:hypothetical protein
MAWKESGLKYFDIVTFQVLLRNSTLTFELEQKQAWYKQKKILSVESETVKSLSYLKYAFLSIK